MAAELIFMIIKIGSFFQGLIKQLPLQYNMCVQVHLPN